MKSNTKLALTQDLNEMIEYLSQATEELGMSLDESARKYKALVRRRGIHSASDLLRLVLVYCAQDNSLNKMGVWAVKQKIGTMSDVAILNRLRNSQEWLGVLLYNCLRLRSKDLADQPGLKVRLQDATVINAPGAKGTQWRIHMKLDLARCCISGVEVTDAHGGETFARLPIEAGEILVADRGYAFASGIGAALSQDAHVIVRINWQSLPLWTPSGTRFALIDWLRGVTEPSEQAVAVKTPQGRFDLRVIACPLPPQAAEEARRQARQKAEKKHHTVSDATLLAAGFVLLVTDLPEQLWPIKTLLSIYRLRWQVEIQFKTFKSVLHFDHLRSKDPQLVHTYLFGKLLIVLLLEQLAQQVRLQFPQWFNDLERPVSQRKLIDNFFDLVRQVLTGSASLTRFWVCLPDLERYVRSSPRARPQQLAWGQAFLEHLSCRFSFFGC